MSSSSGALMRRTLWHITQLSLKNPGTDRFTNLSRDVLHCIVDFLDLKGRLKLRLLFGKDRAKQELLFELLRPALSTLYVSPAKASLYRFGQICLSPYFQKYVTTVQLIPNVLPKDTIFHGIMSQEARDYQALDGPYDDNAAAVGTGPTAIQRYQERTSELAGVDLSFLEASSSYGLCKAFYKEHTVSHRSAGDPGHGAASFQKNIYEALKAGLKNLPGLKAVGFKAVIDSDGLNASCLFYDRPYEDERVRRGFYALSQHDVGRAVEYVAWEDFIVEPTDALFHAIRDCDISVRTLKIIRGPGGWESICDNLNRDVCSAVARKLRKLSVGLGLPYTPTADVVFWKCIVESACGLQELTLEVSCVEGHRVLEQFLEIGDYPSLSKLSIARQHATPGTVSSNKLQAFLIRHQETLCHVELQNMVPLDAKSTLGIRSVLDTMRERLEDLESCKVTVQAHGQCPHHPPQNRDVLLFLGP